jgi:hypothetical protein
MGHAPVFAARLPASLASYAGTRRRDTMAGQGRLPSEVLADCRLALPSSQVTVLLRVGILANREDFQEATGARH